MAALSVGSLPLGFRFRPTDEELINHYLRLKINGRDSEVEVIPEIDICKWEPWDLPGLSVIKTDDPEWFFFCPRDRKYPNGHRSNRATEAGYWKATGKDRTIKSRRSGSNPASMIGMKKTLVFHRGRAPKGERTHWIMHEYRPTGKDLDGTGPGQNAYALFRLFRKAEETANVQKYDEVEPTGSSPTATKSSPDDAASDIVQDTDASDIQVEKQSEGIKRWLTDKLDSMSPNAVVTVESSCNSYMASDVDDHVIEETTVQAYPLHCEAILSQFQYYEDPIPFMDSPFAGDFGNDHNGLHFMDGASEQDISLSELLDEVFNNQDVYSCEESTSQKNSAIESDTKLPGHVHGFQTTPIGNTYDNANGLYNDVDVDMSNLQYNQEMGTSGWFDKHIDRKDILQLPSSFEPLQTHFSFQAQELMGGNAGALWENSVSPDPLFVESAMGSFYCGFNDSETPNNETIPVNYSGDRIRMRHQPSSDNVPTQGTANRRICLQKAPAGYARSRARDAVPNNEEGEVQSNASEAREDGGDRVGGTGIKIRTRQTQNQPSSENVPFQGTANRRIRLQKAPAGYAGGRVRDAVPNNEEEEMQSNASEATREDAEGGVDCVGGTGIKIRTPQSQNQPSSDNIPTQGTSNRRTHLQKKSARDAVPNKEDEEVQSTGSEATREDKEDCSATTEPEKENHLLESDESFIKPRVNAKPKSKSASGSKLMIAMNISLVVIVLIVLVWNLSVRSSNVRFSL